MNSTKGLDFDRRGLSEVFGVMLMLTITIIIACIVSAFIGGFSFGSEEDAISANIVASDMKINKSGDYAYVVFDHLSGDPVDLNQVIVYLGLRSSENAKTSVSNKDSPRGHDESGNSLEDYVVSYGDPDDSKITVGDRFVLYADGVDDDNGIYWMNQDADGRFTAPLNDYITYRIIDTRSNRPISSGSIPVSDI